MADPVEEYRMPLLEHLRELRTRLVRAMIALVVCFFVGFAFSQPIFDLLVAPMDVALAKIGRGSLASISASSDLPSWYSCHTRRSTNGSAISAKATRGT